MSDYSSANLTSLSFRKMQEQGTAAPDSGVPLDSIIRAKPRMSQEVACANPPAKLIDKKLGEQVVQ